MNRSIYRILLWVGMSLMVRQSCPAAAGAQPASFPSWDNLLQMHDAGQYRPCLQQISRLLALKGEAAKDYDQYALLLLRGDCLLHLGDRVTALSAYKLALKSPEPRQMLEARAVSLLIRSSTGLKFTPKGASDAKPIDIADHHQRAAAMLALAQQLRAQKTEQIESTLNANNLTPIINAAPVLIDLYSLEFTATGADTQIHPTLVAIGIRARELIGSELRVVEQRVALVEEKANQAIGVGGGVWWTATGRQGLDSNDREALRQQGGYADQITDTTVEFQKIAQGLGSTGENWQPVIDQGMKVGQFARDVLMAE